MKNYSIIKTNDKSLSLKSEIFSETFHSIEGAEQETINKFIKPSEINRFKKKSDLYILDVCFGIGYNLGYLLKEISGFGTKLNWIGLEIDKEPLKLMLQNEEFIRYWPTASMKIFKSLFEFGEWENESSKGSIIWNDARESLYHLGDKYQFDLIYLDPFSPNKCPELWTLDFIKSLSRKLVPGGRILTYSSAASIRKSMLIAGLDIKNIYPSQDEQRKWSSGTVAIKKIQNQLTESKGKGWGPISEREKEHLLTKASVPYRDPTGKASREDIQKRREIEQKFCNNTSTSAWKYKWDKANTL